MQSSNPSSGDCAAFRRAGVARRGWSHKPCSWLRRPGGSVGAGEPPPAGGGAAPRRLAQPNAQPTRPAAILLKMDPKLTMPLDSTCGPQTAFSSCKFPQKKPRGLRSAGLGRIVRIPARPYGPPPALIKRPSDMRHGCAQAASAQQRSERPVRPVGRTMPHVVRVCRCMALTFSGSNNYRRITYSTSLRRRVNKKPSCRSRARDRPHGPASSHRL